MSLTPFFRLLKIYNVLHMFWQIYSHYNSVLVLPGWNRHFLLLFGAWVFAAQHISLYQTKDQGKSESSNYWRELSDAVKIKFYNICEHAHLVLLLISKGKHLFSDSIMLMLRLSNAELQCLLNQ